MYYWIHGKRNVVPYFCSSRATLATNNIQQNTAHGVLIFFSETGLKMSVFFYRRLPNSIVKRYYYLQSKKWVSLYLKFLCQRIVD